MTGAVVIGRNEGERLARCLASLDGLAPVVYVDSGSTDGSRKVAREAGAEIVELDLSLPFTAARARNAGVARLAEIAPDATLVQFLDADTEMRAGWIAAAEAAMADDPRLAVACGRRRERAPEASRWNRLTDAEWDTPVGETTECGGDALMRLAALNTVGGYDSTLIAGEEPELCHRLRAAGWRIRRLDHEMTWHDAALTRFSQWWCRMRRAGYSYSALARRHRADGLRVKEMWRALLWGVWVPVMAVLGAGLLGPAAFLLLLVWPLQVLRLRLKGENWETALFLMLGKLPEALGVLGERASHLLGRRETLIEYK